MRIFTLKPGLLVRSNGRLWRFQRRLVNNRLLFTDESMEPWAIDESEFYRLYESMELCVELDQPFLGTVTQVVNAPRDLSTYPETHRAEALRRRQYVEGLIAKNGRLFAWEELPTRINAIAQAINDKKRPPSPSTVGRWSKLYLVARCVTRLVPAHLLKGRRQIIAGELENQLLDVINELYLTDQRLPVARVWSVFKKRIEKINEGLPPSQRHLLPSRSSVYRYVNRLDPYLVDAARLGKRIANQNHRVVVTQMQVAHILDRWEIDHTLLDELVVDMETGAVIGRPYITVILDRHSRMVMSFVIHLSAPNTETVLRAIERAIRPKHAWLSRHPEVVNPWMARGLPLMMVPDNAAEFHANDLHLAFNDLGIELLYPKSRGPEMKGAIERFFRTLNMALIHRLPGTTFSNPRDRGDYPSEDRACLTLPELEAVILKWIVDVYLQTPHRGLKKETPADVWKAGEAARPIHLPADLDELEAILAMREKKVLHHYGVELSHLTYNMPELGPIRQRLAPGEKVEVRYRDELGHVWVFDPFRKVFLKVPCTRKDVIGMSRDMYDHARKLVREAGGNDEDFDAVYKAYGQVMDTVENAKHSNKLRQRRFAAKAGMDKDGRARPPMSQGELPFASKPATSRPTFNISPASGFNVRSID